MNFFQELYFANLDIFNLIIEYFSCTDLVHLSWSNSFLYQLLSKRREEYWQKRYFMIHGNPIPENPRKILFQIEADFSDLEVSYQRERKKFSLNEQAIYLRKNIYFSAKWGFFHLFQREYEIILKYKNRYVTTEQEDLDQGEATILLEQAMIVAAFYERIEFLNILLSVWGSITIMETSGSEKFDFPFSSVKTIAEHCRERFKDDPSHVIRIFVDMLKVAIKHGRYETFIYLRSLLSCEENWLTTLSGEDLLKYYSNNWPSCYIFLNVIVRENYLISEYLSDFEIIRLMIGLCEIYPNYLPQLQVTTRNLDQKALLDFCLKYKHLKCVTYFLTML